MNRLRLTALLAASLISAWAQEDAAAGRPPQVEVLHVKGDVYLIAGAGGNITIQAGEEAVVLVDSGLPQYSPEVMAAIRKISHKPVGYIINTTIDRDHTGGNENLAKGGFFMLTSANQQRSAAGIVSHLNLLNRLNTPADKETISAAGWPTDTYDTADWKIYANASRCSWNIRRRHTPTAIRSFFFGALM